MLQFAKQSKKMDGKILIGVFLVASCEGRPNDVKEEYPLPANERIVGEPTQSQNCNTNQCPEFHTKILIMYKKNKFVTFFS